APGAGLDQALAQRFEDRAVAEQAPGLVVDQQDPRPVLAVRAGGDVRARRGRFDQRCSHCRSTPSSSSVTTGLARSSEAPASKHFSRSPFIALAVTAITGRAREAGSRRIARMVS